MNPELAALLDRLSDPTWPALAAVRDRLDLLRFVVGGLKGATDQDGDECVGHLLVLVSDVAEALDDLDAELHRQARP
jgi:hypothetical protein